MALLLPPLRQPLGQPTGRTTIAIYIIGTDILFMLTTVKTLGGQLEEPMVIIMELMLIILETTGVPTTVQQPIRLQSPQ